MRRFAETDVSTINGLPMGLVVSPVLVDGDPDWIQLYDRPLQPPGPSTWACYPRAALFCPVEGSEVGERVGSPVSDPNNVVDFPSVVGVPVSVHRELHDGSE